MPYLAGVLSIERVIRPGVVEDLLRLTPSDALRAIIFDLDASLVRTGLCEFIKECDSAKAPLLFGEDGQIVIPSALENRFEFYKEFYGLSRSCLVGVDILKVSKKDSSTGSADGGSSIKKIDPPAEEPKKAAKPKISKKLEPRNLNTIPAGIMVVAEGSLKGPGAAKTPKPLTPPALSAALGAQRMGVRSFGLGKAATSIKSIGGFGGPRR